MLGIYVCATIGRQRLLVESFAKVKDWNGNVHAVHSRGIL